MTDPLGRLAHHRAHSLPCALGGHEASTSGRILIATQ